MKIIDKLKHLGSRPVKTYDDKYTRWMPVFAVVLFIGMVVYIAYDSFVGVYP